MTFFLHFPSVIYDKFFMIDCHLDALNVYKFHKNFHNLTQIKKKEKINNLIINSMKVQIQEVFSAIADRMATSMTLSLVSSASRFGKCYFLE